LRPQRAPRAFRQTPIDAFYRKLLSDTRILNGAARGIRTPDPIITNDVLYRLSYCGYARGDSPGARALQATAGIGGGRSASILGIRDLIGGASLTRTDAHVS
jgi:hypothetical protein